MSLNLTAPESDQADQDDYLRRVRPAAWKNPVPKSVYDLVILGAGPAGLAAAESAARHGRSVALVERYRLGGNSLNAGSVPSKALISTGRVFASIRDGEDFGAALSSKPPTDFAAVMARMRRIRTRIAEYHSVDRLGARGVDVFFCAGVSSAPTRCSRETRRYLSQRRSSRPVHARGLPIFPVSSRSGISPVNRFSTSPNYPSAWASLEAVRSVANWPKPSAGWAHG